MNLRRKIFTMAETVTFMLIAALISTLTCGFLMFKLYDNKKVEADYSKITSNEHLAEFIENYDQLTDKYYKNVDESELVDSAIKGMLDYLGEPYTEYMDESQSTGLEEQLKGEYTGIGVEIGTDLETNQVYVLTIFPNSPAEKAGVQEGDIFLKLNGEDLTGRTMLEISEQIKYGNEPTSKLVFLRDGKEVELTITREKVEIQSARGRIIKYRRKNIGYLNITTFASPTNDQVRTIINSFKEQGLKEVIIDVRRNSGGYLDSVTRIAEQFIAKDETILFLEDKEGKNEIIDSTEDKTDFKIIVLVDEVSASASEILAGALRDTYGAKLVGKKTFGKGKFQETGQLSSGASIKYTAGIWYLPSDINIDGIGLVPDYEVNQNEEYFLDKTDSNDAQLQKALELIIK